MTLRLKASWVGLGFGLDTLKPTSSILPHDDIQAQARESDALPTVSVLHTLGSACTNNYLISLHLPTTYTNLQRHFSSGRSPSKLTSNSMRRTPLSRLA